MKGSRDSMLSMNPGCACIRGSSLLLSVSLNSFTLARLILQLTIREYIAHLFLSEFLAWGFTQLSATHQKLKMGFRVPSARMTCRLAGYSRQHPHPKQLSEVTEVYSKSKIAFWLGCDRSSDLESIESFWGALVHRTGPSLLVGQCNCRRPSTNS